MHHPKPHNTNPPLFHPSSVGVDELAAALGVPRQDVETQRWQFPDGSFFYHSRYHWCLLIKAIIEKFCPRFTPGAEVLYVGDTKEKFAFCDAKRMKEVGCELNEHGKMPDVIVFYPEKNWLILVESVTSHGPVDAKRHTELAELFSNVEPGLVYATAFPDRSLMARYLGVISWETEVWVADAPDHLIHFNGERFLGPYK